MRGGYIHNRVLLDHIVKKASQFGATVCREASIEIGEKVRFGDLLIQMGSQKILVEAEMSSKRIENDLAKAAALDVCELWLVAPNPRVVRSIRRKLSQMSIMQGIPGLFILLLPQALQRLEHLFELISFPNAETEKKRKWETIITKGQYNG